MLLGELFKGLYVERLGLGELLYTYPLCFILSFLVLRFGWYGQSCKNLTGVRDYEQVMPAIFIFRSGTKIR